MATIGREGIVGVPMLLDGQVMPNARAVSQVKGAAIAAPTEPFLELVTEGGRFAMLVNKYANALFTVVGQNAACNRLHSVTERCARWLLMTRDRVGADTFVLTHEFLSQMLGARRASVTGAAQALQAIEAIRYHRGVVEILDGAALEGRACECYSAVQRAFERLY
jgi:CRP-like cAMP-binding protein